MTPARKKDDEATAPSTDPTPDPESPAALDDQTAPSSEPVSDAAPEGTPPSADQPTTDTPPDTPYPEDGPPAGEDNRSDMSPQPGSTPPSQAPAPRSDDVDLSQPGAPDDPASEFEDEDDERYDDEDEPEYVERFSTTSGPGFFDTYDEAVTAGQASGKPFSIGKTFFPEDHPLLSSEVTVAGEDDDEADTYVDPEPPLEAIGEDTGGPLTNPGITPPT